MTSIGPLVGWDELPYQVTITSDDSAITFDCMVQEQHDDAVTVTEHPVETGSNVADHAQREMASLRLEGIISDHPIVLNTPEPFTSPIPPSVPGGSPDARAYQAYQEFLRLQQTYALLSVTTELRDYENMMITGIALTRDKTKRHILDIALTLREFRKATLSTTAAPEPVKAKHRGPNKGGDKNTDAPSNAVEAKAESGLAAWARSTNRTRLAGGLFGGTP